MGLFNNTDNSKSGDLFFTWKGKRYPKFDGWGRYNIPDPVTGKVIPRTRSTTFAKSLSDTFALNQWSQRLVAKGIATRPDLRSLAAATSLDDRDVLNRIAEDAKAAAGAKQSANMGTAMHKLTERLDRGEPVEGVTDEEHADLDAYQKSLQDAGITVEPGRIEQTVVWPEFDVAGTFDRLYRMVDGTLVVGDVKTGADLSYAFTEIVIQLGSYSAASHIWHWDRAELEPMPEVSREYAIVAHMPIGRAECTLYRIDVAAGIEAAKMCRDVRAWRKRRDLAVPLSTVKPVNRDLIKVQAATSREDLARLWSELQPLGKWTNEVDRAAKRKADSFI